VTKVGKGRELHFKCDTFLVAVTVELAKKPAGPGKRGPSLPREKLNAFASVCCSNCGSINTNQGVFWQPMKIPRPQAADAMTPGGIIEFAS
jgi:hypothetical protein